MNKKTEVFKDHARWKRTAILWLEDDKVVFDCSDEEYGPIKFNIAILKKALQQHDAPYVSDNFQIGPDGAYEHTEEHETIVIQQQLIDVLYTQMIDLSMMSKIELGEDVIAEIKRLKGLLNKMNK